MNGLFLICLAYVFGSVPFGLLLTRFAGLGDIRTIGSGGIGATNVLRTGRKGLAFLTLALDAAKGAVAVGVTLYAYPSLAQFAGLAALIGHMYPVWLRFRGGKGVSTSLGLLTVLAWPVALGCLATWLAMAFRFRYSSLSALIATALAPVWAFALNERDCVWMLAVMAVLIYIKHMDNIVRLLKGTEPKIGQKRHDAATPST